MPTSPSRGSYTAPRGTIQSVRIGLIELHLKVAVPPYARVRIERHFWYLRFGEDIGTMRAAARARKRFTVTVMRLSYADGTKVGRDP